MWFLKKFFFYRKEDASTWILMYNFLYFWKVVIEIWRVKVKSHFKKASKNVKKDSIKLSTFYHHFWHLLWKMALIFFCFPTSAFLFIGIIDKTMPKTLIESKKPLKERKHILFWIEVVKFDSLFFGVFWWFFKVTFDFKPT